MADSDQSIADPSSASKRQSLSGEESVTGDGIDRISKLPDSVLCEILAFLPTKMAVATSILSKRWQFLWTWVPSLDFEERDYDDNADDPHERRISLAHIVCRLLLLRRQWCIKRFRLKCGSGCDSFHLDSWVCAAIERKVEELDLSLCELPRCIFSSKTLVTLKLTWGIVADVPSSVYFPSLKSLLLKWVELKDEDSVGNLFSGCSVLEELILQYDSEKILELPSSLFSLKMLVVLHLFGKLVLDVPSHVHFPSLKILHLENIKYKDDNTLRNLLSGCPVLKDMSLIRVEFDNVLVYEISSPTLRILYVDFRLGEEDRQSCSQKLRVNAPALEEIFIGDNSLGGLYFGKLGNLVEADLEVFPCDKYRGNVELDVLQAMQNVAFLELYWDIMKAFCNIELFHKFPEFSNIVELTIRDFCCSWGVLQHMLQKFLTLKHLILYKNLWCEDEEPVGACRMQVQPLIVPSGLALHLTSFCFRLFQGLEDEMEFVSYILKNSMILKNITIFSTRLDPEKKIAVLQKLEMFERGSKKCQLKFH